MKKTLFLFLFIPILSYSQITYDEVMSIDSTDSFIRVMIENGYEKIDNRSNDSLSVYGINLTTDSMSSSFCFYGVYSQKYILSFNRTSFLTKMGIEDHDNPYDLIVKDIKKKCDYHKIINDMDTDFVSYFCKDSKYDGKIGFTIRDGWGYIRNFPNNEE